MRFEGFAGNEALKARLSAAFDSGRAGHCYLLCGVPGSGRHTLGRILAAALECTAEGEVPCGVCPACRKVLSGQHPDVITVDDAEHKTLPVELIRKMRADAFIRPNEGRKKVYILPRAQDMAEPAQNALLKILEEPPAYAVFLLYTTNAAQLLPTVRSRCAELALTPVRLEQALPILAAQHPDRTPEELSAAYARADGYLGQASALLAGPLLTPAVQALAEAYCRKDRMGLLRQLLPMEKYKREQMLEALTQLLELFCGAMEARGGMQVMLPLHGELLKNRSGAELLQAIRLLQSAADQLAANVSCGAVTGVLAAKLY